MPQTIIRDIGGTLETYFEQARPASVTVTLRTGDGSKKLDGVAATVDTVSTTVSSAVTAGATTVALASASGVVSGRRYMLGLQASTAPQEVVTVKSVTASTATLFAPAIYAHPSGDAFRCGRVTYTISAASADALWFDGFADFTPDSGDTVTEVVDCTLHKIPDALIDLTYCLRIFAEGQKYLSAKLDVGAALKDARDKFLQDVGGKVRAHTMLGAEDFKYGAALTFWLLRMPGQGDAWVETAKWLANERQHEIAKLQAKVPVDADQDAATTGADDGGFTSGTIERA